MKILSIGSDRNLFVEGSAVRERAIEYGRLCDELHIVVLSTRQNFQFSIFNFQKKTRIQISNNVWIYPTDSINRWFYIIDAYRIGKRIIENCKLKIENSRDALITSQDPFESGLTGWLIKRHFNIPQQLQIHTDFLSPFFRHESFLNKIRVLIAKFLISRADCLRVVSARIEKSLKIVNPPGRMTVRTGCKLKIAPQILPIYINPSRFVLQSPAKVNLHQKYPQFDFIILMVSRLSCEKNVRLAISAMREVVKSHPKTGLIIVGNGPEERRLRVQATGLTEQSFGRASKLQANIIFIGEISGVDLSDYYHTTDAFLLTSNYEGYGLVLLEAALSGCPIVTTDVGIAGELLRDGKEAFICPVGEAACLSKRMREIIESATLREQFARNAREAAEKKVVTKDEYLRLYKESWNQCLKNNI